MRSPMNKAIRPWRKRTLGRAVAAVVFSLMLGVSGDALAAPHGGVSGGGFHGGGFHGGGFHGGGFHGGGFHARRFRGGFHRGFTPGLGLGLAFGLGYPWAWGYYPPDYGYYGYAGPYAAAQNWYYCYNPAGYYPYVTQCYGPWQVVPAS
jgi:hypothetical protein